MHIFDRKFPSTLAAATASRQAALCELTARGWEDPRDSFNLWLCLEEALTNAVRHGNRNDPAKMVRLEIAQDGDECHIAVFDEGTGFDPDDVALAGCGQLGGRGVYLLRHYANECRYDRTRHCLELVLRRKPLNTEGDGDEYD